MDAFELKKYIIDRAETLGFADVAFARAERMDEESRRLEEWLNNGRHGKMDYMENYFEKRVDPTKLVPGAKTVVVLAFNYYTEEEQKDPDAPKISKYALGRDYHRVLKKKLKKLFGEIEEEAGELNGRYFVDSAPVLERDWARRSGLGWMGKNTMIIHPKRGSYFFLAEMIFDLELPPDDPISDYCGTCRRCIEACPTDAIDEEGYSMDGSRCISYLTIENKDEIPAEFEGDMENWMFGCDICQDVCPWNSFSEEHDEPDFGPRMDILDMEEEDWHELTEETFDELFSGSAVRRTKYEGLKRNIAFLEDSQPEADD